jgi:hypothetical protein
MTVFRNHRVRVFSCDAIVLSSARSSSDTLRSPKMPPEAAAIVSQSLTRSSAVTPTCECAGESRMARIKPIARVNTCSSGHRESHSDN